MKCQNTVTDNAYIQYDKDQWLPGWCLNPVSTYCLIKKVRLMFKKRWHAVFSLFSHNIRKYICFIRSITVKKKTTNKYPSLRFVRFLNQESCCTNMTHRPWWRRLTCSRQHNNGGCRGGSSWGRLVRQFVNGLSIKETSFFLDCQTIVCPASSDRI